jgi:hypothetical protein
MNDIFKSIVDDNVKQRYKILMDMESLKNYSIVRDYADIIIDENYNLKFVLKTQDQRIQLEVLARATSIRSAIKKYNKDCLILNEFLNGYQGQDQIEALEYVARACETDYKQFNSSYVNYLKGKNKIASNFNGNLPMETLKQNKEPYSSVGVVLSKTKQIALNHFQQTWIKAQEELKKEQL